MRDKKEFIISIIDIIIYFIIAVLYGSTYFFDINYRIVGCIAIAMLSVSIVIRISRLAGGKK